MIRFGLAGLGRHGIRYARHLQRGDISGATLSGVWRRDEVTGQAQAAELDALYHPNFDDLVADEHVDAIILAVPAGRHGELAPKAAAAGKPLLIEKPLAPTTQDATAIVSAFESANVPLTVAQTLRFDPLVGAARAAASTLGSLVGFGFEQRLEPRGLAWEEDPSLAGGGVLTQTAIHAVDALRFLTQCHKVEVVHALMGRVGAPAPLENHALLHLALTDVNAGQGQDKAAVHGDVRVSKIGHSRHHRYALFYEDGGLELDFIDRELVTTLGRDRTRRRIPEVPTVVAILEAFVRFLSGAASNPVEPTDAWRSLAAIEAAYAVAGR